MSAQQGMFAGHPRRQRIRLQGGATLTQPPLVVEATQPAAADQLTTAADHPAVSAARQWASPRDERSDRFAGVLAPAPFVPEAQPVTVHLALAARHRAGPRPAGPGRMGRAVRRVGVELLPADHGRGAGPSAAVAAAVMMRGRAPTARGAARPRGGPVAVQVAGEQPPVLIPFTRTPARVEVGL